MKLDLHLLSRFARSLHLWIRFQIGAQQLPPTRLAVGKRLPKRPPFGAPFLQALKHLFQHRLGGTWQGLMLHWCLQVKVEEFLSC
jgi:hypothetical protein